MSALDFDVVIIGAGFAGAATAWALLAQAPALRLALVDRDPALGAYASGRSAGMGRQLAEDDETTALTLAGARALREHGAGRFWHEHGGLLTFDEAHHLVAYQARAAAHQLTCRAVARPELERLGLHAEHGLWVPSDGLIEVREFLAFLVTQAQRRGAALELGTEVTSISFPKSGPRLETPRGTLTCRAVVEATGAWAGALTGRAFAPLRRHVHVLPGAPTEGSSGPDEPPATAEPRLASDGPFVWHLGAREVYLRPRADGTWLSSPCDEHAGAPGDQSIDLEAVQELEVRLGALAPAWARVAPQQAWSCQRTFTAERRMVIERDSRHPSLVWAAALGGHGATAACAVGQAAAELVRQALADY